MGENVDTLKTGIEQINHALMAFVMLLMKIAPFGIFCLVTARFGAAQAEGKLGEVIQQTGWYMMTVLSGLGIHALVTLPVIFLVLYSQKSLSVPLANVPSRSDCLQYGQLVSHSTRHDGMR